MEDTLEIMYDDLTEEAQKRVSEFYGEKSPDEGNYDISPLFILSKETEEEDPDLSGGEYNPNE